MPTLSVATANSLLNYTLRGTAYSPPATLWVALFTTPTTATATGTEVTGGSYARKQVTFNAANNGACVNSADITILGMPAATIVSMAVMSASSGGSHLFYGTISKTTNAGDTFTIRAGDLNVGFIV